MPVFELAELNQAIASASNFPTIVQWNRLEGRPRAHEFDRALRAEVRDALWMLTRQWQMGEFIGDDAGSPLGAKVHVGTSRLESVQLGARDEAYDDGTPLEAKVERQRVAFVRNGVKIQLDLRLEIGRQWAKLLGSRGLGAYRGQYRRRYAFTMPPDDRSAAAADVYSHSEAWQELAAVAGRAIDGGDLYLFLRSNAAHRASDEIALSNPAHEAVLDELGTQLVAWFDALYFQPPNDAAWDPAQLEYSFSCTSKFGAGERRLVADEYPGGHLDWHSFDFGKARATVLSDGQPTLGTVPAEAGRVKLEFGSTFTRSFLPSPLTFDGMPNTRWWKFEDGKVSFGDVTPATTDLAKLLLIEFGLVYANDWFLLPFRLPAGSLAIVRGMTVTNSFGERFWVEAAGSGAESAWEKWRMFTLSTRDGVKADLTLFLAPSVPKIQNGRPLDEVFFVRDELANMVWCIEARVPLVTGETRPGSEVARETAAYHRKKVGAAPNDVDYVAPIHYRARTSVPEHWIPFLPVHVEGSNREIQLQRGGMLRLIDGDPAPPEKIAPATPTIRRGLDTSPKKTLFVHEEEVPRGGTRVTRGFQRTRWRDGRTFVWLGMNKETGRGEASSRLAFDQITTVRKTDG
jgi:hypothetical protein